VLKLVVQRAWSQG